MTFIAPPRPTTESQAAKPAGGAARPHKATARADVATPVRSEPRDALAGVLHQAVQRRAKANASGLPAAPTTPMLQRFTAIDILDLISPLIEWAAAPSVAFAIIGGTTDHNKLTNIAFWFSHPEIEGEKLNPKIPGHKPLIAEWVELHNDLVVPMLTSAGHWEKMGPAPAPTPAPTQAPAPAPAPAPERGAQRVSEAVAQKFYDEHAALLDQLTEATTAEKIELLRDVLAQRSSARVEFTGGGKTPVPLTHKLYMSRHKDGVNILEKFGTKQLRDWEKHAVAEDGWAKLGVDPQVWVEVVRIRDRIIYPFMRIVLPRVEAVGELGPDATGGEKIAHRAHVYLGVRYASDATQNYKGEDPSLRDPFKEAASMLDCLKFVYRVCRDVGLPFRPGVGEKVSEKDRALSEVEYKEVKDKKTGKMKKEPVLETVGEGGDKVTHYLVGGAVDEMKNSPDLTPVLSADLRPGDLLFRRRWDKEKKDKIAGMHVGIYVGTYDGKPWFIHAPQVGRVVSKDHFDASEWDWFKRRKPA